MKEHHIVWAALHFVADGSTLPVELRVFRGSNQTITQPDNQPIFRVSRGSLPAMATFWLTCQERSDRLNSQVIVTYTRLYAKR